MLHTLYPYFISYIGSQHRVIPLHGLLPVYLTGILRTYTPACRNDWSPETETLLGRGFQVWAQGYQGDRWWSDGGKKTSRTWQQLGWWRMIQAATSRPTSNTFIGNYNSLYFLHTHSQGIILNLRWMGVQIAKILASQKNKPWVPEYGGARNISVWHTGRTLSKWVCKIDKHVNKWICRKCECGTMISEYNYYISG